MTTNRRYKVRTIGFILVGIVIAMFFFGYAMVPLYNVLCVALGINGKTSNTPATAANIINHNRIITVQFLATNNANLPWKFYPQTKTLKLHPGQSIKVYYYAQNDTDKTMTVQAVPSVTPSRAAKYLMKTECFCFNQQTLKAKQQMKMPLLFHIDGSLPKNINTITLSYTLFDVTHSAKKMQQKHTGRIRG